MVVFVPALCVEDVGGRRNWLVLAAHAAVAKQVNATADAHRSRPECRREPVFFPQIPFVVRGHSKAHEFLLDQRPAVVIS